MISFDISCNPGGIPGLDNDVIERNEILNNVLDCFGKKTNL